MNGTGHRLTNGWQHVPLGNSWKLHLGNEFREPYMQELLSFLRRRKGKIYPAHDNDIFAALNATRLNDVKVVIVGQDPYHGPGEADGYSFSVKPGVQRPDSLRNIFQEINSDGGVPCNVPPDDRKGCLLPWAHQGVLLLNAVLTVDAGSPGSHRGRGWETFTDRVVETVNRECDRVVFLLWGIDAKEKGEFVCRSRHEVLEATHPSGKSAAGRRGGSMVPFRGCRHFSKANDYLVRYDRTPIIDWCRVN